MNRRRLLELVDETFGDIAELNNTKGREYADDEEALSNFYNRAKQLDLSPKKVWGIFFGKHIDAIFSYIKREEVLSEPIEGRIDDAILYLILLKGLIEDQNGTRNPNL